MLIYIAAFVITAFFAGEAPKVLREYRKAKSVYGKKGYMNTEFCSGHKVKELGIKFVLFFVLALLPLFLVSALRYGIGTDYFYTYYPNFYKIYEGGKNPYSEWGFYALNVVIQLFTSNAQWLFVITSFIFVFVLTKVVTVQSENAYISVIVVLIASIFFVSMNNIRQSITAIICLAALPYMEKRDTLKYFTFLLLASLFHLSAFIMAAVFILAQLKFIRKHFLHAPSPYSCCCRYSVSRLSGFFH